MIEVTDHILQLIIICQVNNSFSILKMIFLIFVPGAISNMNLEINFIEHTPLLTQKQFVSLQL